MAFRAREAIDNKVQPLIEAFGDGGILEKVLGMQKKNFSALMDGETLDSELLQSAYATTPEMRSTGVIT